MRAVEVEPGYLTGLVNFGAAPWAMRKKVKKNQADLKASLGGENMMWQRGRGGDFIPALVGVLGAVVEQMSM